MILPAEKFLSFSSILWIMAFPKLVFDSSVSYKSSLALRISGNSRPSDLGWNSSSACWLNVWKDYGLDDPLETTSNGGWFPGSMPWSKFSDVSNFDNLGHTGVGLDRKFECLRMETGQLTRLLFSFSQLHRTNKIWLLIAGQMKPGLGSRFGEDFQNADLALISFPSSATTSFCDGLPPSLTDSVWGGTVWKSSDYFFSAMSRQHYWCDATRTVTYEDEWRRYLTGGILDQELIVYLATNIYSYTTWIHRISNRRKLVQGHYTELPIVNDALAGYQFI